MFPSNRVQAKVLIIKAGDGIRDGGQFMYCLYLSLMCFQNKNNYFEKSIKYVNQ